MAVAAMNEISREYGLSLKPEQKQAILSFAEGKDVFCCLPTGYGKSFCYSLLPRVFDRMHNRNNCSIVICILPLVSLMMDQQAKFLNMGITAEFISETHSP